LAGLQADTEKLSCIQYKIEEKEETIDNLQVDRWIDR